MSELEKITHDWLVPGIEIQHFKGNVYRVVALGRDAETTEPVAVYQPIEGGDVWVRRLVEFSEMVTGLNGMLTQRFVKTDHFQIGVLANDWLQAMGAVLVIVRWMADGLGSFEKKYDSLMKKVEKEILRRGLECKDVFRDWGRATWERDVPIVMGPTTRNHLKSLSDDDLKVLFAASAEVADFSCLGRDVRDYVMQLFNSSGEEMESRRLERHYIFDYEGRTIIINCKESKWYRDSISYEELVKKVGNQGRHPSVAFKGAADPKRREGCLAPGESVKISDDETTVFSVYDTSNA